MNAAEYRTLREACGLTLIEAATLHGLKIRAVQSWEEGSRKPAEKAVAELVQLTSVVSSTAAQFMLDYRAQRRPKGPVKLVRFHTEAAFAASRARLLGVPFGAYNAMIARVMAECLDRAIGVTVSWDGET